MRTNVTFPSAGLELAGHEYYKTNLAAAANMQVVGSTCSSDTWPEPAERAL